MKIGNLEIKNNVFLGPMAGITDLPFRLLCKEQGCGLLYTEMVSAKGLHYGNKNTEGLLRIDKKESPIAIQLFGREPEILAESAVKIEEFADIIDINMGCPVPKIVNNGEGSALMKNPELVGEIVRTVSRRIHIPLTIKFRKGFNLNCVNAVEIAKIAEENGASAVTVHGRTREQYYEGKADWDIIREVKDSVSIPVIGSGDVVDEISAKAMIDATGCDAVMIARGARGNPWIFKEVNSYLHDGKILPHPTDEEKIQMLLRHMQMQIEYKGEYVGIREIRKHAAWYVKGMKYSSKFRLSINNVETAEEFVSLVNDFA